MAVEHVPLTLKPILKTLLNPEKYLKVPAVKAESRILGYNKSIHEFKNPEDVARIIYKTSPSSESFLTQAEYSSLLNETHFTELFAYGYYPTRNMGSARHLLNGQYQIKGAGRNQLAARPDYQHSWGGMYLAEAFREYVVSNHLQKLVPEISVNHFAFGIYLDEKIEVGFILRDFFLPRLVQMTPTNLKSNEIDILKAKLKESEVNSSQDFITLHIRTFLQVLKLGLVHQSYNVENITIDGKLIDLGGLVSQPSSHSLALPVFQFENQYYHYFQLLLRVLDLSVIPLGSIIYSDDSNYDLKDTFYNASLEVGFSRKESDTLFPFFETPITSPSTYNDLFPLTSKSFQASYQEDLQRCFHLWNKMRSVSEDEAFSYIEKIITNPNAVL